MLVFAPFEPDSEEYQFFLSIHKKKKEMKIDPKLSLPETSVAPFNFPVILVLFILIFEGYFCLNYDQVK